VIQVTFEIGYNEDTDFTRGSFEVRRDEYMMFTVINVLHRKPTDNDYWQLHQHTCPEILRFQADGYDVHALEADTIAAAKAAWIDCDLEYMGYGPQDLRVMPCCQEAGQDHPLPAASHHLAAVARNLPFFLRRYNLNLIRGDAHRFQA
jgi:hypothetical protein